VVVTVTKERIMVNPINPTIFVPDGDSRQDTAVLLVGTADEYGIDQRAIRAASGGFYVTDEVYDAVFGEGSADEEAEDEQAQVDAVNAAAEDAGSEPADEGEDEDEDEDVTVPDYDAWDYADLKKAVAEREIEVADQRKETLVSALQAADADNA